MALLQACALSDVCRNLFFLDAVRFNTAIAKNTQK